jgi:hypothetical protein
MSDEVDNMDEELMSEFVQLGGVYPYVSKMLMDMIGIISQQNTQLEAIMGHIEILTAEVNKHHLVLNSENSVINSKEEFLKIVSACVNGTEKETLN